MGEITENLQRAANGDSEAADKAIDLFCQDPKAIRIARWVRRALRTQSADVTETDSLLQQCHVKLLRIIRKHGASTFGQKIADSASLRGYSRTVIKREALKDIERKEKALLRAKARTPALPTTNPLEAVLAEEQIATVMSIGKANPEAWFTYRAMHDVPHGTRKEIASALECSVRTAERRQKTFLAASVVALDGNQ